MGVGSGGGELLFPLLPHAANTAATAAHPRRIRDPHPSGCAETRRSPGGGNYPTSGQRPGERLRSADGPVETSPVRHGRIRENGGAVAELPSGRPCPPWDVRLSVAAAGGDAATPVRAARRVRAAAREAPVAPRQLASREL